MTRFFRVLLGIMCLAVSAVSAFAADNDIYTTLVIIEETENHKKIMREPGLNQPFTDGIYESLWDFDGIFFDTTPTVPFTYEQDGRTLSPIQYIKQGIATGADSVLLIKVNYSTSLDYSKLVIILDDLRYNLFSIHRGVSVTSGDLSGKYSTKTERVRQATYLRSLGKSVLKDIFSFRK